MLSDASPCAMHALVSHCSSQGRQLGCRRDTCNQFAMPAFSCLRAQLGCILCHHCAAVPLAAVPLAAVGCLWIRLLQALPAAALHVRH